MLNASLLLTSFAPVLLTISISPVFWLRQRDRLRSSPSSRHAFNYLLADQRGISAAEYTVFAGAILSVGWLVFVALGNALIETSGGA